MIQDDNRITIRQAKEALMQDDIHIKDNVNDPQVLQECYRALSVVENILEILANPQHPDLDYDRIRQIIDDAYPYWYIEA